MRLGLILVTLLALAYVQAKPAKPILMTSRYQPDYEEMKSITVGMGRSYFELNLRNAIFGFKGFLAGAQKGFYNNDMQKVSDDCFGTLEVQEDLKFAYDFMTRKRPITDVVKFTTRLVGVINTSMDTCGYTGSVKMLQDFCRRHYTPSIMKELSDTEEDKVEKPRCSQTTLVRNFYTRIFNHIAAYSRVATLLDELNR